MLNMGMNISNVQPPFSGQMAQGVDAKRLELQMLLLKKSLESQQSEADALTSMTDGKGQNLDIRV